VHDPHVTTKERDEAAEAAIAEAYKLLRPLAKPARSRAIINWNDPDINWNDPNYWDDPDAPDPRDLCEAAIEHVIALLEQPAAGELWGAQASIVRKNVLSALRLARPPKRKGPRGILLRDRCIAAVVTTICQRHGLKPYRNPTSKHTCNGCSVVANALNRLEIRITEKSIMRIYAEHKQA
jgi:hypothetical protein